MKYAIYIAFFFIFFFKNSITVITLCLDIGGTRIKAALLKPNMTLEQLKQVKVVTMSSEGWLSEKLPTLFDSDKSDSFMQKINGHFDTVAFGITGPVYNRAEYVKSYTHIPRFLKAECENILQKQVTIENDTLIWSCGAVYWNDLISEKIQYPCLGITLGTGVGVVLLRSPKDMLLIEISFIDCPFIKLFSCAQEQPIIDDFGRKSPHRAMGSAYFNWVREQHNAWDKNKIKQVFNQRIEAFCKDIQVFLQDNFDVNIKSIMFGGGNSRFLDKDYLHDKLIKDIIMFDPAKLISRGVSSDIISLLGCTCLTDDIETEYLPSIEEITQILHDDYSPNNLSF